LGLFTPQPRPLTKTKNKNQEGVEINADFYSSAYPLASVGHAAWILRHYGYRAVFIWGLCLYALGALIAIPCIKAKSFGGFCASIFIIGNGLGSLETAANPFITGTSFIAMKLSS
jgi:fucose permease